MKMEIYLVRHGKTKGNEEHRYVGRTDEALSEAGIRELEKKMRKDFQAQLVYSSPMLRCRQTANLLFPGVPAVTEEELRETDFGIFEYKNYEELKNNAFYQKWIDEMGEGQIPQGESGPEFRKRSKEGFLRCLRHAEQNGLERIAFVVHGGTIMTVMDQIAGDGCHMYDWQVENGGGYYAGWDPDKVRLEHVKRL